MADSELKLIQNILAGLTAPSGVWCFSQYLGLTASVARAEIVRRTALACCFNISSKLNAGLADDTGVIPTGFKNVWIKTAWYF